MPRPRKNATPPAASLAERLRSALVPEEEQPYPVPANWCWVYLKGLYEVTSSKRIHKIDWVSEGIPFYRTRELVKLSNDGYVDNELFISYGLYESIKKKYDVPSIGDILISGVGTIGIPFVIKNNDKFYFKDGNIIWFKNNNICNPMFIFYLYKSLFMSQQIHDMSAGTTVDTYTIINANNTKIPCPPLAEQQRIVERIESLFAKLDEAKTKLEEIRDGHETRRAAILHKAFTGELTRQWREEHGVGLESWEERTLGEYANNQYGYTEKSSPNPTGPKFLRITDIQNNFVNWDEVPYCKASEDVAKKYALKSGDIVVARTGATTGKSYIIVDDVQAIFASYLIRVTINKKDKLDKYYLYNFLQTPQYWEQITELSAGIAQPGVNSTKLQTLRLPIPNINEQREIVRLLDSLLARENRTHQAATQALEHIDLMKKAILAKAFRGELGTNVAGERGMMGEG